MNMFSETQTELLEIIDTCSVVGENLTEYSKNYTKAEFLYDIFS